MGRQYPERTGVRSGCMVRVTLKRGRQYVEMPNLDFRESALGVRGSI
jgi:hypothetical protein